jgi:hypothetical protein
MTDEKQDITNNSSAIEPPNEFIQNLVSSLQLAQDTNSELLDILKTHILKIDPSQDALDQAMAAIWKLAAERAVGDVNA